MKDLLALRVDIETKKLLCARLGGQILTASETLTILWFYQTIPHHRKIHALAKWGVSVEPLSASKDKFIAQNGITTVMYNYFGYEGLGHLFSIFHVVGLLSPEFDSSKFRKIIQHGMEANVVRHTNITFSSPKFSSTRQASLIAMWKLYFLGVFCTRWITLPMSGTSRILYVWILNAPSLVTWLSWAASCALALSKIS